LIIKYSQIYANTDVLSPIDRETWQVIAEAAKEDELVRRFGEEFVGYMTFIMKRP
jgi:hypothetical protein